MYAGFADTGFSSVYASTNIYDDFAESMAFYLMASEPGMSYTLDTKQGDQYDMLQRVRAPAFVKKYAYVKRFLSRTDISYP